MTRRCDSCNPSFVSIGGLSGVVHERGCPDAWRDEHRSCKWCGTDFTPEERGQTYCCHDCYATDMGLYVPTDEPEEDDCEAID